MSASLTAAGAVTEREGGLARRFLRSRFVAVGVVLLAILAVWYVAAFLLNAPFARSQFAMRDVEPTFLELLDATYAAERPVLPAPHQVGAEIWRTVFAVDPTSRRSLVHHAGVTLSSTVLGFVLGTLLGIGIAVAIVHVPSLDKSLMPWIVASQTIPILAIAPMVIVVLASVGLTGLLPKAIISAYLSFFPVAVGVVTGLRSPEPIDLDLMRTYSATPWQTFWKLRWPCSVPFLFVSMRIAVAASLVGAIVGEMPTGAVAGLGARLLSGSYYGQTVQIWAALIVAAVMAAVLVGLVGLANRIVLGRMGMRQP